MPDRIATDKEIAELREGLEGVTPWKVLGSLGECWIITDARCSPDAITALLARLDASEAALREAREIVRPLSHQLSDVGPNADLCEDNEVLEGTMITYGDLRAARAWLQKQESR